MGGLYSSRYLRRYLYEGKRDYKSNFDDALPWLVLLVRPVS